MATLPSPRAQLSYAGFVADMRDPRRRIATLPGDSVARARWRGWLHQERSPKSWRLGPRPQEDARGYQAPAAFEIRSGSRADVPRYLAARRMKDGGPHQLTEQSGPVCQPGQGV